MGLACTTGQRQGLKATSHGHDDAATPAIGSLVAVGNDAMPHAIKAVREGVAEIDQVFALGHKGQDLNSVLDGLSGQGSLRGEVAPQTQSPTPSRPPTARASNANSPDVFSLWPTTTSGKR